MLEYCLFSEWRSTFSESHFKPVAIHELPKASHSLRNEEYILRVWGAGVEGQALRRGFLRSWVWRNWALGLGLTGGKCLNGVGYRDSGGAFGPRP